MIVSGIIALLLTSIAGGVISVYIVRYFDNRRKNNHQILICSLPSRQMKYLKFSANDACISIWSVGIFYAHHFSLYLVIRLFFEIGLFYRYITSQCFLVYF